MMVSYNRAKKYLLEKGIEVTEGKILRVMIMKDQIEKEQEMRMMCVRLEGGVWYNVEGEGCQIRVADHKVCPKRKAELDAIMAEREAAVKETNDRIKKYLGIE